MCLIIINCMHLVLVLFSLQVPKGSDQPHIIIRLRAFKPCRLKNNMAIWLWTLQVQKAPRLAPCLQARPAWSDLAIWFLNGSAPLSPAGLKTIWFLNGSVPPSPASLV